MGRDEYGVVHFDFGVQWDGKWTCGRMRLGHRTVPFIPCKTSGVGSGRNRGNCDCDGVTVPVLSSGHRTNVM